MNVVGIIPARWGSTRFEGKVLADIAGKPMIQHVFERVCRAKKLDDVFIATDDKRVLEACDKFGAKTVMTSVDHASGTDRIAEAVAAVDTDYVINIQGDEPLIDPGTIDALAEMLVDGSCEMATVVKDLAPEEKNNPHVVKACIDNQDMAVSFSRSYEKLETTYPGCLIFKHLGIYGYQKDFLRKFKDLPPSASEKEERLEQLRAVDAGIPIKVVHTAMETIGVDTLEDLEAVRKKLT